MYRGELYLKVYICEKTNEINEEMYSGEESGYCIVAKYDYAYIKELPRFRESGFKAYGLPYNDAPEKLYFGIGNSSQVKDYNE